MCHEDFNNGVWYTNAAFFSKVRFAVYESAPYRLSSSVARFITAQICLESDFGRSRLALEQNNFIGMKRVAKRLTTQQNYSQNEFGQYQSFESCIFDYWLWCLTNSITPSILDNKVLLVEFLRKHSYSEDSEYFSKIEKIMSNKSYI